MKLKPGLLMGRVGPPQAEGWAEALPAVLSLALLVLGGISGLRGLGSNLTGAAVAQGAGVQQCYAWGLFNGAGVDADGLRVRLSGVRTVSAVYIGDANPLGEPRPGAGYDAATNTYTLDLGVNSVVVEPAGVVKVGVCTPDAVGPVRMQWLAGTTAVGDPIALPAIAWSSAGTGGFTVHVKNTGAAPVTVVGLRVLVPQGQPGVDDLDVADVASMDPAGSALEAPMLLAGGQALAIPLDLGQTLGGDNPAVLALEWVDGEDLAATATVYAILAADAGGATGNQLFLPAISRS